MVHCRSVEYFLLVLWVLTISKAAFTIKEVRELTKIPSVVFHPVDETLMPDDTNSLPRPTRRIMEVLKKGSVASLSDSAKSWSLDFCLSPIAFNAISASSNQLGSMSFERTSLSPDTFDPHARAQSTGEIIDVASSLAFRSIGYKSEALKGFDELNIPFNDRSGIIPNDEYGRVLSLETANAMPGMYCAGWVKRGPTGVIASTMADAFATAESVTEDWYAHAQFLNNGNSSGLGWDGIKSEADKRGCRRVSWSDWKKIDAVERSNGQKAGKEREKFTSIEAMLAVLD